MHIDVKATIWERIYLPDDTNLENLVEKLKTDPADTFSELYEQGNSWEYIPESQENLNPEDNDGYSTIEVYKEAGENALWENGIGIRENPKIPSITRNQFMEFFRSDEYNQQLSVEDKKEVFATALAGEFDFTKEFLDSILSDYGVTNISIVENEK